jgi:hypothetical protein
MVLVKGLLIDACGNAWSDRAWDVTVVAGIVGADGGICTNETYERGFIHIAPHAGGIEVAMRAGTFNRIALTRTLCLLSAQRPRRIVLTLVEGDRRTYEIFPGVWEFAQRAEPLVHKEPA